MNQSRLPPPIPAKMLLNVEKNSILLSYRKFRPPYRTKAFCSGPVNSFEMGMQNKIKNTAPKKNQFFIFYKWNFLDCFLLNLEQ